VASDQREVWTAIADSFDRTRQRPWAHVVAFLGDLPRGSRVLDLMAGNGRHAKAAQAAGHSVVCLDWSRQLVTRAAGDRVLGDAVRLPFRAGTFDACAFVAGLHGLPTAEDRLACLRDLHRVLRPDGVAQVTVWSRDAPRFRDLEPRGQAIDVEVPWKADGHAARRTYHLHTPETLRAEAHAAGFTVARVEAVAVAPRTAPGGGPDNLVALLRKA
jgi:tRNA (uracil-5-)-methyltransferase TRM9